MTHTTHNSIRPYTVQNTHIFYGGFPFAVALSPHGAQMTALALNTLWEMRKAVSAADKIIAQMEAQVRERYGVDFSKMQPEEVVDKLMEIIGAAIDTKSDTQRNERDRTFLRETCAQTFGTSTEAVAIHPNIISNFEQAFRQKNKKPTCLSRDKIAAIIHSAPTFGTSDEQEEYILQQMEEQANT